jgi:hypothetical protein
LYLIYAVLNALFVPFVYLFVVETAGKSLEQIDRWFASHPGWRVDKTSDTDGGVLPVGGRTKTDEDQQRMLKAFGIESDEEDYDSD